MAAYGVFAFNDGSFLCLIQQSGKIFYNQLFKSFESAAIAYNTIVLQERLPLPLNKIVRDGEFSTLVEKNVRSKKNTFIKYIISKVKDGWSSVLYFDKHEFFLGIYDSPDKAARAYNTFIILRGIRCRLIDYQDILEEIIEHNKEILFGKISEDLLIWGPPLIDWLKED